MVINGESTEILSKICTFLDYCVDHRLLLVRLLATKCLKAIHQICGGGGGADTNDSEEIISKRARSMLAVDKLNVAI